MTKWIFSIVGIVFISVLIDIIIPSGKTNKFIKGIFSVFILFVFLSPLKSIVKKVGNISVEKNEIGLDENFLAEINISKNQSNVSLILNRLKTRGIEGVNVIICNNIYNFEYNIEKVLVDTTNIVLSQDITHINKYEVITNTILEIVNIEKDKIIFNDK